MEFWLSLIDLPLLGLALVTFLVGFLYALACLQCPREPSHVAPLYWSIQVRAGLGVVARTTKTHRLPPQ